MDFFEQCRKWRESQQKIDLLKAIPDEERTPEMDCELAKEYIFMIDHSQLEYSELLKTAINLLEPHEEYFENDYTWNSCMGCAYFYLDQKGRALPYFEKAQKARPDDGQIHAFISQCKKGISEPHFLMTFRERVQWVWERFTEKEAGLRQMIEVDHEDKQRQRQFRKEIEDILKGLFAEDALYLMFMDEKFHMLLMPQGNTIELFKLVYLQKHVPQKVLKNWEIKVGMQHGFESETVSYEGWEIHKDDVQIWLDEEDHNRYSISAYCEKLLPLLEENESDVRLMLVYMAFHVLGEISFMRYIPYFNVLNAPKDEPGMPMSVLPDYLKMLGLELSSDPRIIFDKWIEYKWEPDYWFGVRGRNDVTTGATNCMPIMEQYMHGDNEIMDKLHADGITAGYFGYPINTLRGKDNQTILDFRRELEDVFNTGQGPEILTIIGGATGLYCDYVDFIAWDIHAVLKKARAFFESTDIPWAYFNSFYKNASPVFLKKQDKMPADAKGERSDEKKTWYNGIDDTIANAEAFFSRLNQLEKADEYAECIAMIEAIPKEQWDYRLALAMARALAKYALIGDRHERGQTRTRAQALLRAIKVLESVRQEGENQAEWNMRMANAYQYLRGQEEKAIPYALRWAELDPEGVYIPAMIKSETRHSQRGVMDVRRSHHEKKSFAPERRSRS